MDQQVKVRGHRIEPAEIEQAILSHAAVLDAAAVIRKFEGEEPDIICFVTTPRSSMASGQKSAPVSPRNEIEAVLCEEFADVLNIEVGITDNFFDLGGHSLMATKLAARISRRLEVRVTVKEIFDQPILLDLAATLRRGSTQHSHIVPHPYNGPVEQSFAQGRLWFLERLYPGLTWYLSSFASRLRGSLNLEALSTALLALEERHEGLRTTFQQHDGVNVQVVQPFVPKQLRVVEIPGGSEEELMLALQKENSTPFDLETEPGWRPALFRLGEDYHVLSIVMHHIISDGWSLDILQREMATFYTAALRGKNPLSRVNPLPIHYRDFALWQKEETQVAEHERQLSYWKGQLDGSQPATLLCDKPRPAVPSGTADVHEFIVEGVIYQDLQKFCRKHQTTPFSVLFAAFRATHYRLTGMEDATIGTPIANRNRQELEDLIGFFVNLQCIRTALAEDETFETLVKQVVSATAAASANQDVPFDRLVAELRPGTRDVSRHPLVQMTLAVHYQQNLGHLQLGNLSAEPLNAAKTSRFDLELHFFQERNRLRGVIMFSNELFDSVSINSMETVFQEVLRRGLEEPSIPITSMPLIDGLSALTEKGLAKIARTEYPRDASVPALFREQVALRGDAIAVKDNASELTYTELDQQSDQLASWLVQRGFAPETMIGVLAPRSCEAIVALLGILKANLAYLPLDVNVPLGRLESILTSIEGKKLLLLGAGVPPRNWTMLSS
ncbi:LOW QUALITY PROTEIN: AMP-binding enzyme [Colletotrichum tofieldiae]|nr:LOW QUALITY PROTEIN: AMP-binding enzyme [Colletotrichum tofieldiae]